MKTVQCPSSPPRASNGSRTPAATSWRGTVVALALIPEAIAFSIIAGVDPAVGLYASFLIAVTIAFVGGRPAMISAATGAMSLLMGGLVRQHGLDYLFAASSCAACSRSASACCGWAATSASSAAAS